MLNFLEARQTIPDDKSRDVIPCCYATFLLALRVSFDTPGTPPVNRELIPRDFAEYYRVSEYLMGDLDGTVSLASSASSKTKSCENLAADAENNGMAGSEASTRKSASAASVASSGASSSTATDQTAAGATQQGAAAAGPSGSPTQAGQQLSSGQMDAVLLQLEQGVEVALHRAKLWSKYAKDIMTYVEKRCNLELEFAKNVAKLAQTMRSALKEEVAITRLFQ